MLQYKTVNPGTLELLKKIMAIQSLNDFVLVGGTALALRFGHRKSIDLDLFTPNSFDPQQLVLGLRENNIEFEVTGIAENTLNILSYGILVDFIKYGYPNIRNINNVESIRLISIEDIACMKLSAITNRGSKKDFYDLYYLLKKYSLKQLFGFYREKYDQSEYFHIIKSLVYFEDAENDPDPVIFDDISWPHIKQSIQSNVKNEFEI